MSGARRLLVASRPRFWLYLAGPVLVGAAFGAPDADALFAPATLALFAYFLVPANVFLYGVNDVFDADADRENPKKRGRETRFRGERVVVLGVLASLLASLPVALVVPPAALPWVAGFLVLGAAYSAPPLRFKTRPPLDSLSNGLYVLPGVAAFVAASGHLPSALAVLGGWLWTMGMHAFSAIPDVEPDRRAGVRTTATLLGPLTYGYCAAAWLLAAACYALLDARAGALLLCYPLLAVAVARSSVDVDRAYWWFPAVNTAVGAAFTVAGLWRLVRG